jgi:hypothetical protein
MAIEKDLLDQLLAASSPPSRSSEGRLTPFQFSGSLFRTIGISRQSSLIGLSGRYFQFRRTSTR